LAAINASDLQTHVDVLADDSFEGREAGSRGGRAASMYLLQQLEQRGLRGAGDDGGYFQPFGAGCRNVLALLEGSDPQLKQEVVVVSAHYDHVGYGNRGNSYGPFGYVHNGADDNASGASGVLETIDAFLTLSSTPRRSILFAFWDGEEKGLLGSKHWVAYPTVALDKIVFMINADMIGRLREGALNVYGTRTAPGLRRLVSETSHDPELKCVFNWELKANSDHHSFASRDIPTLMFHTGLHDDYHRPSDDAHKVNSVGMEQVSRMLFLVSHELADRPQSFAFRSRAWGEFPSSQAELEQPLAPRPPRLGIRWKAEDAGPGVLLAHVEPGSAAERAGLSVGDRLLTLHGEPISDSKRFSRLVLHAPSVVEASILKPAAGEPVTVRIELDGAPTRVGVSWREDAGEPGTFLLTRVVTGSPAEEAGLRLGDRIYQVGGSPLADSVALSALLSTLPSPIELTIERAGCLQTVSLHVPELLPSSASP